LFNIKKIRIPLRCIFGIVLLLIFLLPTSSSAKGFGPYTGRVLDKRTGTPIKGASFFVYLVRYIPTLSPEGIYYQYQELAKSEIVYTDNDGKYSVPKSLTSKGLLDTLESTTIIIYQPGYQVYINRDSPWNEKPNNFKKKDNLITLDRIPPNFDHKNHYEKITSALSKMGESVIIPPIDYDASPKGDKRMDWDKFVDKSQPSILKEEFLRRAEWENRRE
jgi:hypothetical protein